MEPPGATAKEISPTRITDRDLEPLIALDDHHPKPATKAPGVHAKKIIHGEQQPSCEPIHLSAIS
jgi:hypothetical protein